LLHIHIKIWLILHTKVGLDRKIMYFKIWVVTFGRFIIVSIYLSILVKNGSAFEQLLTRIIGGLLDRIIISSIKTERRVI